VNVAAPIVLTKSGLQRDPAETPLAQLREEFARNHLVKLPGLFSAEMLDIFHRRLPDAAFSRRVEDGVEIEHTLEDPALLGATMFTLNDPALFQVVSTITGCGAIGCFSGRVQSRHADERGGHYYPWHTDAAQERLVGLSVNLSDRSFDGGVLQIRHTGTERIVAEVANRQRGDGVLFRISEDLEHHVTPVSGDGTRLVIAGWFRRAPDFWQAARCVSS